MYKLLSILCLLATVFVHAEPSGGKKVKVRFLAERVPPEIGQVVLAAKELKSSPFDLPVSFLSPAQSPPERVFALWSVTKNLALTNITLPEER